MMKDFLDVLIQPEQRSAEWHDLRIGRFTASEQHRLMTPVIVERDMTPEELEARPKKGTGSRTTKVKYEDVHALSKGAITYVKQKVAEQLTGCWNPVNTAATAWGEDHEPEARAFFEERTGLKVKDAFFIPFSTIAGGTPDGRIPEQNALVEFKCPYESHNMIEYLMLQSVQDLKEQYPEHYWQIQSNLTYAQAAKCYFVAYDPRMPEHLKMKILEVFPVAEDQNAALIKVEQAHKLKEQIINGIINQ